MPASSLSELGNEALRAFEQLTHALACADPAAQLDPTGLKSEKQRFQLWAVNLGLYHPGHSSLDYRLRDNETIRSFTASLLIDLRVALDEITAQIASDNNDLETAIELLGNLDSHDAPSNQATPGANPVVTGLLNDDEASLLELRFEDVTESIDELLKLASQIRSASSRKFRTDIDLYRHVDEDFRPTYVAARDQMEKRGIEQMLLQCRTEIISEHGQVQVSQVTDEDSFLVKRLKKANHTRRQQFEYWKRFRSKSARETAKALRSIPLKDQEQPQRERERHAIMKIPTGPQSELTGSLLSSVTVLPQDFEFKDDRSTITSTSRGLTIHGPSGQSITWPEVPREIVPGKPFECPYCFFLCPYKYLKNIAWRTHIKHDLRPYVCTYSDCPVPDLLYDSFDEWSRHEQWTHRRIWRCPEHPEQEYTEQSSYKSHLRTRHAEALDKLLSPALLEAQKFTLKTADRLCPFCHADFEENMKMQEHVASHLEMIALLSLPNLDDVDQGSAADGGSSNAANRNAAGSRNRDFEDEGKPLFAENDGTLSKPTQMDRLQFQQGLASLSGVGEDETDNNFDQLIQDWTKETGVLRQPTQATEDLLDQQLEAPQPDWDVEISKFVNWVDMQKVNGTPGPVSADYCPFVPLSSLEIYLKEGNRTRRLLESLFGNRELPIEPEDIWRNCIKSFSILLLIGKGIFIQHFMRHDQLWDVKLPFLAPPLHFPHATGDGPFFESFWKNQWQFCPYIFRNNVIDAQLEKERILPIMHREQLVDSGIALTCQIKLHPAYDYLTAASEIHRDPNYRYENVYVLKTFRSRDAREYYNSELKTVRALIPRDFASKSIIGFYGSFIQHGSYNILLEYADRGTLEQYLDSTRPPTTGEDVYKFWSALFNVIKALKSIHDITPTALNDPPILQGWHGDVKPSNILVMSGKDGSRFDYEFKLNVLELDWRISPSHQIDSNRDIGSTREHSAPECYRFDEFMERSTRNYSAPECYRFDEFMERSPRYIKKSVDIWSLGCVFSEAAVWVVRGQRGLEAYRRMREDETKKLHGFRDIGCFHDGERVLQSVGSMHEEVSNDIRGSDHVTMPVVERMITEMLDEVDGRPNTIQLWRKSQKIMADAVKKLETGVG